MTIQINNFDFVLLFEKALYKPDEQLLIIADVHLGKAAHFRKGGISIPAQAQAADYDNLKTLFHKIKPKKVYFLGDLFHSSYNNDWNYFCDLIALYHDIKFTLIKGNHDLINQQLFTDICVEVVTTIEDEGFVYTHDTLPMIPAGKVMVMGHIHPGITLSGMGKQSLKLPCFYITDDTVILPAFGVLTGLYSMNATASSRIYAVLPDCVKRIS
jgi:DNA ligase-associated metallophosphoesterase